MNTIVQRGGVAVSALKRILIVDDDTALLRAWTRDLKDFGLLAATSAAEARQALAQSSPDVAIIDLWIGLECGLDLVSEIKTKTPPCFVILTSAELPQRFAKEARDAGANLTVDKPVSWRGYIKRISGSENADRPEVFATVPNSLYDAEGRRIAAALRDSGNNITHAAERLDIRRSTLQRKLRKRGWRSH